MNVYVLGAGVSADVGYPLGWNLFAAVNDFVKNYPSEFNRFDFNEWSSLCDRLAQNDNIPIRMAYQFGNFELLMTALDHFKMITTELIKHNIAARKNDPELAKRLGVQFDS